MPELYPDPTLFTEPLPIGEEAYSVVSKFRDIEGNFATGNVLRRFCTVAGKEACKAECQLMENDNTNSIQKIIRDKECADINLKLGFDELDIRANDILMVGVTGNNVGFADKLSSYDGVRRNPHGWQEVAGFNAFFARKTEVPALGCRLADCSFPSFEFEDSEGRTVIGFVHGTRGFYKDGEAKGTMFGVPESPFEFNGKANYVELALGQAFRHYDADPANAHIRLIAAIQPENYEFTFDDANKMVEVLPGWRVAQFLKNVTNSNWKAGHEVFPEDTWQADAQGLIKRDIIKAMARLGIPEDNFTSESSVDAGGSKGVHSSNTNQSNSRDVYLTFAK